MSTSFRKNVTESESRFEKQCSTIPITQKRCTKKKRNIHIFITLPSILPMVSVMFLMRIGRIVNAGFDQIYNLYSPLVYDVADVLDILNPRNDIMHGKKSVAMSWGEIAKQVQSTMVEFYEKNNEHIDEKVFLDETNFEEDIKYRDFVLKCIITHPLDFRTDSSLECRQAHLGILQRILFVILRIEFMQQREGHDFVIAY